MLITQRIKNYLQFKIAIAIIILMALIVISSYGVPYAGCGGSDNQGELSIKNAGDIPITNENIDSEFDISDDIAENKESEIKLSSSSAYLQPSYSTAELMPEDIPGLRLLVNPQKQLSSSTGVETSKAFDYSGNNYHGIMKNMSSASTRENNAFYFDGKDDYIDYSMNKDLISNLANSDYIIGTWIKTRKRSQTSYPFTTNYSNGIGYIIEKYSGRPLPSFMWDNDDKSICTNNKWDYISPNISVDVADGKWHFVAIVSKITGDDQLYVDSIKIASLPLKDKIAPKITTPLYMGYSQGDKFYFQGYIGISFLSIYETVGDSSPSADDFYQNIAKLAYDKTKNIYANKKNKHTSKTYYFSSEKGGDANDCKSMSAPCKSLKRLHEMWNDIGYGDSILFERGSLFAPDKSGAMCSLRALIHPTFDKRGIKFASYGQTSKPKPIISVENIDKSSNVAAFALTGAKSILVKDIEFRGGIRLNAFTKNGIQRVKFYNIVLDNQVTGGRIYGTGKIINEENCNISEKCETLPFNNIIIANSNIKNIQTTGVWLEGIALIFVKSQGNIYIRNNEFNNPNGDGHIDIAGGDNIIIENNKFIGPDVPAPSPNIAHLGLKIQPSLAHTLDNLTIRGNLIVNHQKGINIGLIVQNATNSKIHNNTIVSWPSTNSSGYSAFFGNSCTYPTLKTFNNNFIANNIFVGVVAFGIPDGCSVKLKDGQEKTFFEKESFFKDNYFSNNIYHNFDGYGQKVLIKYNYISGVGYNWNKEKAQYEYTGMDYSSGESQYYTIDDFESDWISKSGVQNDMNIDPELVNPHYTDSVNYGNYHLKPNSPAIEAGISIKGYYKDLDGNDILSSNKYPHIGCYQNK